MSVFGSAPREPNGSNESDLIPISFICWVQNPITEWGGVATGRGCKLHTRALVQDEANMLNINNNSNK